MVLLLLLLNTSITFDMTIIIITIIIIIIIIIIHIVIIMVKGEFEKGVFLMPEPGCTPSPCFRWGHTQTQSHQTTFSALTLTPSPPIKSFPVKSP